MAANDRTVVVTGGTSGLGFQLAAQLTRTGEVDVVLTGRSATTAQTVAARIGARGAALDLGSLASVHDFAAHVTDLTGGRPLHALVANAGIPVTRSPRNPLDAGGDPTAARPDRAASMDQASSSLPRAEKHPRRIGNRAAVWAKALR